MSVSVTFLGAAKNVTGSRHLVDADGVRVLVDCGLYQERHNAAHNWEPCTVPPASIDAAVLTHAHIDHVGWLPRLVREGFRGLVHCSLATADMVPLVLADAANLQAEDAAYKQKRHATEGRQSIHPVEPLYDDEDVEKSRGRAWRLASHRRFRQSGVVALWLSRGRAGVWRASRGLGAVLPFCCRDRARARSKGILDVS
jgi:metallo-beta-lactamase family protein